MAQNGTFQKGNWTPASGETKMHAYLPSSQSKGIAAQTLTANSTVVLSFSVPFQFKGNGAVDANFPFGQFFQNSTGQPSLGEAWLTQATSYSGKTNPTINIRIGNAGTAAATITAGSDLIITQL
jgi:hypothetical protein